MGWDLFGGCSPQAAPDSIRSALKGHALVIRHDKGHAVLVQWSGNLSGTAEVEPSSLSSSRRCIKGALLDTTHV